MVDAIEVKFIERMNKMKKLFAALLIAMLVVLPMTAFANAPTFEDPEAFMEEQDPAVVKPLIAVDYLTPEEPRPIEVVDETVVPATGVFAAVAASAALLAMGLAVAKKN
jgi:hypothetical protein